MALQKESDQITNLRDAEVFFPPELHIPIKTVRIIFHSLG
jgi:hypothetical protein